MIGLYDKIAKQYDLICEQKSFRNEEVFSVIQKHFTGGKFLDIGCGTGILLKYCKVSPKNYMGIDVSSKMIKIFRKKYPEYAAICGDFDKYYFKGYQNMVALYGVASYLSLRSLKRIAREGNYFLMFYREDYYPTFYSVKAKRAMHRKSLKRRIKLFDGNVYRFLNYVIVTNKTLDYEPFTI